jgi:hypothetical protein
MDEHYQRVSYGSQMVAATGRSSTDSAHGTRESRASSRAAAGQRSTLVALSNDDQPEVQLRYTPPRSATASLTRVSHV